jgi:release factor glutamine methyltransferase
METLLSILKKTTEYFQKYGIENPKLDAELMVAHVLRYGRMQLYLDFERPMDTAVLDELRPLMKRRANREPLQYILGKESFLDFELKVDSRALIPRPETEELVEKILTEQPRHGKIRILDIGTGTGVIACSLARHYPDAEVVATDIAADTLALARENIEALELSGRITLILSDWFSKVEGKYDIIVSNPPYLSDAELLTVAPEVSGYEPSRALTSGPKGVECIEILINRAFDYLNPGGVMYIEVGAEQGDSIREIASLHNGMACTILRDLSGKERFVRITGT